jgi:glutamate carboxypeptidase
MDQFFPYLDWIDSQQEQMLARVKDWADINSHSLNINGLNVMLASLKREFSSLGAAARTISLDSMEIIDPKGATKTLHLGSALHLSKRQNAPIRFFFGGHFDTVYPVETDFINCMMVDQNTLVGPGVTDMKGGLAVMLTALEALEKSPFAESIGYEILLNPDEEIGSPGSSYLFKELSKNCRAALLFEPAFPDESLAGARKGSSNHTILVKGTSAHAGRDFFSGKSAIAALSELLIRIHELNHPEKDTTLNLGYIYGGGPVNIVPDLALCRINIRAISDEEMRLTESRLDEMIQELAKKHRVEARLFVESRRPPKPFDKATEKLFMEIKKCGEKLGQKIEWNPTGGACDGNTVAAEGIPAIDSLGAIGGEIHTHNEFLLVDSLTKRAKLTALYLMKAAQ